MYNQLHMGICKATLNNGIYSFLTRKPTRPAGVLFYSYNQEYEVD